MLLRWLLLVVLLQEWPPTGWGVVVVPEQRTHLRRRSRRVYYSLLLLLLLLVRTRVGSSRSEVHWANCPLPWAGPQRDCTIAVSSSSGVRPEALWHWPQGWLIRWH